MLTSSDWADEEQMVFVDTNNMSGVEELHAFLALVAESQPPGAPPIDFRDRGVGDPLPTSIRDRYLCFGWDDEPLCSYSWGGFECHEQPALTPREFMELTGYWGYNDG
jgi:hypothetical protein